VGAVESSPCRRQLDPGTGGARLNLRPGKIYRQFGLCDEILDAVPAYYGIEPPELFDAAQKVADGGTARGGQTRTGSAAG
jgi:hypothetical protein